MSEPKVDIKIEAHVQVGEMRKMEEALQREIVQMRLAGAEMQKLAQKEQELLSIRKKIATLPRESKFKAAAHEFGQSIPGVGPLLTALNGSAGVLGGSVLGIGAAFRLAADSIRAFAASEVEMAKLDAALANSGKLTDAYREKLSKLATERSGKTGIDDEKYLGVFTTLTKFGADTGNIDDYTRAVENLAGFMGGDLEQAAFLFGKAMQGSTEMLGRYGINVDKSKSETEQLAEIMRQLEARGGGQLEAMGDTLQGSFNKVSNAWENLLESMGSAAESSGLAKALSDWANGVQIIADKLGGGSTPKLKNREDHVGSTPEEQKQADLIMTSRQNLNAWAASLKEERDKKAKEKSSAYPWTKTAKSAGKDIEVIDKSLAMISDQQAELDAVEKKLGLRKVTPEEGAKIRESQALKTGSVEFSPGGNGEDIALAKDYAEEVRLKKEAQALARADLGLELQIANATADGNENYRLRLQWIKEYNAAGRIAEAAGMEDPSSYATDTANAGSAGRGYKPGDGAGDLARKAIGVSSAARLGMAVGESRDAAGMVDVLRQQISLAREQLAAANKTADNTEKLLSKATVYE